jgi:hypothetical protein
MAVGPAKGKTDMSILPENVELDNRLDNQVEEQAIVGAGQGGELPTVNDVENAVQVTIYWDKVARPLWKILPKLTKMELNVYCALQEFRSSETNTAVIGIATLMGAAEVKSRSHLFKAIKGLEGRGLIERTETTYENRPKGYPAHYPLTNTYKINYVASGANSPFVPKWALVPETGTSLVPKTGTNQVPETGTHTKSIREKSSTTTFSNSQNQAMQGKGNGSKKEGSARRPSQAVADVWGRLDAGLGYPVQRQYPQAAKTAEFIVEREGMGQRLETWLSWMKANKAYHAEGYSKYTQDIITDWDEAFPYIPRRSDIPNGNEPVEFPQAEADYLAYVERELKDVTFHRDRKTLVFVRRLMRLYTRDQFSKFAERFTSMKYPEISDWPDAPDLMEARIGVRQYAPSLKAL